MLLEQGSIAKGGGLLIMSPFGFGLPSWGGPPSPPEKARKEDRHDSGEEDAIEFPRATNGGNRRAEAADVS